MRKQNLDEIYETLGCEIRAVLLNECLDTQGIHLIDPTDLEIRDATDDAAKDNFGVVWCHYTNVVKLESK